MVVEKIKKIAMCCLTHVPRHGKMPDDMKNPKKPKKPKKPAVYLEGEIRKAIKRGGWTTYRLAKESGVHHAVIIRFINGDRGITLTTASKLAVTMGLEMKPKRKRK